jgi:hypothetical protein
MNKQLISMRGTAPFCVVPALHRARRNDWAAPTNLFERFRQIRSEMAERPTNNKGASK